MPFHLGCSGMPSPWPSLLVCVRFVHCLVDTVKGGEPSYTALAMEGEQSAYSSLVPLAGAVQAKPGPMPSRMERGGIALAFTAGVRAIALPC